MIKKKYKQLHSYHAITLDPEQVCENFNEFSDIGFSERTHPDGWTIAGIILEDYFHWVNDFSAYHPSYGEAYGDFEEEVFFESEEAAKHFLKNHSPIEWDYGDI